MGGDDLGRVHTSYWIVCDGGTGKVQSGVC